MRLSEIDFNGIETVLLDRDGVINKLRRNDYVKNWDEFEFLPNVLEDIAYISKYVNRIFIVTNQRGVGKGIMTENDLNRIHSKMLEDIERSGGRIDHIYYCTAVEDDNFFRKPNIGMWLEILKDYPDVTSETTIMIGDSDSDMKFAENCGMKFVRVL